MPELPEVETVCRGLSPVITGRKIISADQRRPNLRFPFPENCVARLTGAKILRVWRRAKYVMVDLNTGETLIVHLGMSGRLVISPKPVPRIKHDHFVFTLDDGHEIVLNDARRFGSVDMWKTGDLETHRFFEHLGPEPLSNDFHADVLVRGFKTKKTAVKVALLDQRIVVGMGNIYVAEALYQSRIDPRRPAKSLNRDECERLVVEMRAVLTRAIEAGGSSLKDYVKADGELGYFQHNWAVYNKAGERCPDCVCDFEETGGIQKIVQGGRSTFYCAALQK